MEINITESNRVVKITAQVADSLHASLLADQLNKLPYLKVNERKFNAGIVLIVAFTIPGLFSIAKLHEDLDSLSNLFITPKTPADETKAN